MMHRKKEKLFEIVIPSKLVEAVAMGVPVLHGVKGESADVEAKEGVGILFEPENPCELADMLVHIHNNPEILTTLRENALRNVKKCKRRQLAQKLPSDFLVMHYKRDNKYVCQ
jgi:glycosyltransferase involved in cell wall biosynthesis